MKEGNDIYKGCPKLKPVSYTHLDVYKRQAVRYISVIILAAVCCVMCSNVFMKEITIASFAIMAVIITLIFNGIFLLFFGRTSEFRYLYAIFRDKVYSVINRRHR